MQLSYQKKFVKAHPWCSVLFHLLTFSIYFSSHQKCKTKMWDSLPRRTSHATAAGTFSQKIKLISHNLQLKWPPAPSHQKIKTKRRAIGIPKYSDTYSERRLSMNSKWWVFFAVIIHSSIYPFIYAGRCDGSSQFTVRFQKKKESNHEIPKINMMQPKSMLWNYLKRRVKVQRMDNKFAMKLCRLKVYFTLFIFVHPPSVWL